MLFPCAFEWLSLALPYILKQDVAEVACMRTWVTNVRGERGAEPAPKIPKQALVSCHIPGVGVLGTMLVCRQYMMNLANIPFDRSVTRSQ